MRPPPCCEADFLLQCIVISEPDENTAQGSQPFSSTKKCLFFDVDTVCLHFTQVQNCEDYRVEQTDPIHHLAGEPPCSWSRQCSGFEGLCVWFGTTDTAVSPESPRSVVCLRQAPLRSHQWKCRLEMCAGISQRTFLLLPCIHEGVGHQSLWNRHDQCIV